MIKRVGRWVRQGMARRLRGDRFETALQRMAGRSVTDTITEADVQAWIASIEAIEKQARKASRRAPRGGR